MRTRILFFLILLFALAVSIYHLEDSPRVWFDEGIYLQIGKNFAEQGIYSFQLAPDLYADMSLISVGYPVFLPMALFFKIFGASILVGRSISVFFILGLLTAVFLYIRKIKGSNYALISIMMLATFSALYGHGKNVLGEVPGLFWLFLGSFYLAKAEEKSWNGKSFALSGLFLGLAIATKPSFIPFAFSLFAAFLILGARRRPHTRSLLIFLAALALPVVFWFLSQFNVATNWQNVLNHHSNPYGFENLWSKSFENLLRFLKELTPAHFFLLFTITSVVFIIKFSKFTVSQRALYFFVVLTAISYLRTPGWYRYFFIGHVILIAFLPIVLEEILKFVRIKSHYAYRALIFIFFATNIFRLTYNIDRLYNPIWRDLRSSIESIKNNKSILFLNVPEGVFFAKTNNYYQVLRVREGLIYGEENLQNVDKYDLVIFHDNESWELPELEKDYKNIKHIGSYYLVSKYAF